MNCKATLLSILGLCIVAGAARAQDKALKLDKDGVVKTEGQLTSDDAKDKVRMGSFCKIYTIKLSKDRSYSILLESKVFDSFLRLESADGKRLEEDDDSGGTLNALIRHQPAQDGTYRIVATTFPPNQVGKFNLSVREGKPAKPIAGELKDGGYVHKGELNDMDPIINRRNQKVHTIKLPADKTFVIDLLSKDFDPVLLLQDSTGKVLAKDDDGGGALNSRITFASPMEDTYRLIVTTYLGRRVGVYTLKVQQK